jgi:hypothetical protein
MNVWRIVGVAALMLAVGSAAAEPEQTALFEAGRGGYAM